jgi:serine/threonine-protein phosphatase 6 regulatory ankyrin repeat subunit B
VAHHAGFDCRDKHGVDLLTLMVKRKQHEHVNELLKVGADANVTDTAGRTALSYAADNGDHDTAGLLLAAGADRSIADEDGWTPLIWASDLGWDAGVAMLLQHGGRASLTRRDRYGQTALVVASRMGHADVVRLLLQADPDGSPLNVPDNTGWTALIQAAKHGGEVLGLLLDGASHASTWASATAQARRPCTGRRR